MLRTSRKRRGKRSSVEETRCAERLNRVLAYAELVWNDYSAAHVWMSKPHCLLNDETPFEAARTELGAPRVESLLDKLFYGLPV